ncbi:MAG: TIGR02266 family protein [Deltaproteobacteria bacterium]|nr:TIGR02266 family protein [Deltaproteobacteria bacterium]MBN2673329.1 TIGR02266 family protein [Deltaproteobacteria bacterium]
MAKLETFNTDEIVNNDPNRRSSNRVRATFQVRYKTLDSLVSAYTENISKGGIYVRTSKLLPLNTVVRIKLVMPHDGPEIECIGQVARVHKQDEKSDIPTGMAIVFRDMSAEHRAFIEDYISDLTTQKIMVQREETFVPLSIVVVDDDRTVRERASKALISKGHTVRTAEDGLSGLATCLQEPPDLILSDVQMPKMDGWNFLKTIRARASLNNTLVVFQTSLRDEKDRLLGYQLGVDDYIAKPYTTTELLVRINRLVNRTRKNNPSQRGSKALRGDLEQVSLPTVLSLLEMDQKTGICVIVGPTLCRLYIRKGRPLDIEMEGATKSVSHVDMMVKILSWTTGQFEFSPQEVHSTDKIKMSMQGLLMESARVSDEQ